jgi:hypothetical protein
MCDPDSEVGDAEIQPGRVVTEFGRRQGLMRSAHLKWLREWNAKFPADRLPYVVVVVDGFAQFRAADASTGSDERKGRQAVVARWQEIGRTGRAVACTWRFRASRDGKGPWSGWLGCPKPGLGACAPGSWR